MGNPGTTGATGAQGPAGQGIGTNAFNTLLVFTNEGPPEVAGTTYYFIPVGVAPAVYDSQTTISYYFMVAPSTCTMKALNLGVNNYGGSAGSDTTTVTVYLNGAATSMHTSVTTAGTIAASSDTTHTLIVIGGDSISIGFKESNINPYNKVTVGLICQ
jgi:hypothetical protein